MTRYLILGIGTISVIAAMKTLLIARFVMNPVQVDLAGIVALFTLFFVLTTGVAYLSFIGLRSYTTGQRKMRLAPGAQEPIAKETVIARHAPVWGLSQAEADVAIFVAKGFSNSEVAEMRGCAIATVKSQLGSIYNKSGLESRYQLIAFVTDEVCAMAKETGASVEDAAAPTPILTRSILPLVGRSARRAPNAAAAAHSAHLVRASH
ncbi:Transcriptional regulator, LuxR family protein [Sulfitobacter noctilucae]|uniref:helix-turn-helix transcriptional regulator n=1 Tax=Sulfitobacter noctilucae TaxID=1342302 RepID=UPI000468ECAC|nr:helix-turn-helix transcriptional regulator [Sulfitobacter noctilucae]KIN70668.1 Transcriptional regulator, LuxR family protein [Sulfitobacter noctilucae]